MIIKEWENRPLEDGYTDEQRRNLEISGQYDSMPFRKRERILMNNADFREHYKKELQDFVDSYSIEEMIELGLLAEVPEVIKRFEEYLGTYYSDYYTGDIVECMEQLSDYDYKVATDDMLDDLIWTVMNRDILIPEVEERMRDDILMNYEEYFRYLF